MSPSDSRPPRNPGPTWGYRFLRLCDRVLPEVVFRPLRAIGTGVAMVFMPEQRRHSRDYLSIVLPRRPTWRDIFRHFFTFEETLMLHLRVADGKPQRGELAASATGFRDLIDRKEPALLGTFHVGHSDIVGFLLGRQHEHRVSMVRLRVGNSHDVDRLAARFGRWVSFIWVNEPANLLFALKEAVDARESIALKCDRIDFSSKTDTFDFLGARRSFPFTIYHLALIFKIPVVLSIGLPGEDGVSVVHSSECFVPDGAGKAANLARAHAHFQAFLHQLETVLRGQPWLWFNFLPLNPPAP